MIKTDSIVLWISSNINNATVAVQSRFRQQFQRQMSEENSTALDISLLGLILVVWVEGANPPVILLPKSATTTVSKEKTVKNLQLDPMAAFVLSNLSKRIRISRVGQCRNQLTHPSSSRLWVRNQQDIILLELHAADVDDSLRRHDKTRPGVISNDVCMRNSKEVALLDGRQILQSFQTHFQ